MLPNDIRLRIHALTNGITHQEQVIDRALDSRNRETWHLACQQRARFQGRIQELLESLVRGHQVAAGG